MSFFGEKERKGLRGVRSQFPKHCWWFLLGTDTKHSRKHLELVVTPLVKEVDSTELNIEVGGKC